MSLISNVTAANTSRISLPHDEIEREIQQIKRENNGKLPDQEQLDDLLFDAVEENAPLRIKALLSVGARWNAEDDEGKTVLHWAAYDGHKEALSALLESESIDLNKQDDEGSTPLHCAVDQHHTEIARILLGDNRIDPTVKTNNDETTLHIAVYTGSAEMIRVLVQDGRVDPNERNSNKETTLIIAARKENPETAQALLEDPRTDPNLGNHYTPLQIAAIFKKHLPFVQVLLKDPRTNPNFDPGCANPLLETKDTEIAFALLQNDRIDPNCPDDFSGYTALHKYALQGNLKFVQMCLAKGANPMLRVKPFPGYGNKKGNNCFDLVRNAFHRAVFAEKPNGKPSGLKDCFEAMRSSLKGRLGLVFAWEQMHLMNDEASSDSTSAATTAGSLKTTLVDLPMENILQIMKELPLFERIPPIEVPPPPPVETSLGESDDNESSPPPVETPLGEYDEI